MQDVLGDVRAFALGNALEHIARERLSPFGNAKLSKRRGRFFERELEVVIDAAHLGVRHEDSAEQQPGASAEIHNALVLPEVVRLGVAHRTVARELFHRAMKDLPLVGMLVEITPQVSLEQF